MAIFGIGAGKIDLRLSGTNFHPGDTIDGFARLQMNESMQARGVVARFEVWRMEGGGKHQRRVTLYEKKEQLDTERTYGPHESLKQYTFKFTVPEGILNPAKHGNDFFGGIMGWMAENANKSINWEVQVKL